VMGLDLGQKRDHSALVIVEQLVRSVVPAPTVDELYHVVHVQRWSLGTPYESVVDEVCELAQRPELSNGRPLLLFDRTGLGGVVAEDLWNRYTRGDLPLGYPAIGITLTAGFSNRGAWRGTADSTAHKGDVIARMASLLNTGRLVLPPGLPAGDLLEKELRTFQIKQRASGYIYTEAAHEKDHDDLVIALALAVWCPHWIGTPRYLDPNTGQPKEQSS